MAERQLATQWHEIRGDHRARYVYSLLYVSGHVIDAACGCGYGSQFLATSLNVDSVLGIDVSNDAINFANENWSHEKTRYLSEDLNHMTQPYADWLVCFETLEHLENPSALLQKVRAPRMICSVPNQAALPFTRERFPYHYRHYTPTEFDELLMSAGWDVIKRNSQHDAHVGDIKPDTDGRTLVYVCTRKT